jgi:hypothetical protein
MGMAVREGRDGICSSCLAHVVEREVMDVKQKSEKIEHVADGRSEMLRS